MKKIFILCLVLISINAIAQQVPPIPNGRVAPTYLANVIDNYYFGGSNQAAATKYWWQNSGCNIEQQHIDHFINVREYGVLGNGTTNEYNNLNILLSKLEK